MLACTRDQASFLKHLSIRRASRRENHGSVHAAGSAKVSCVVRRSRAQARALRARVAAIIATPVLWHADAGSGCCCQLRLSLVGLGVPLWACNVGLVQPRLPSLVGLHSIVLSPASRDAGALVPALPHV